MTFTITKQNKSTGLISTVARMSGVKMSACLQCKKCSSGCPVAKITELTPSELVRRINLGVGEELLDKDFIWMCLSCGTCYARCPMGIDVAAIMDALRELSLERQKIASNKIPVFNQIFLRLVKNFGRTYDLPMLLAYKIRTGNLLADAGKLPGMLAKGKISVLPPSGADKKTVRRIFNAALKQRKKA